MIFDFLENSEQDLERIEAIIAGNAAVKEAVAIIHENTYGVKNLTIYIVPSHTFFSSVSNQHVSQLMRIDESGKITPLQYCLIPGGHIIKYEYFPEVEHTYADMFFPEAYLRHGITLSDNDCVFDVGANIGLFSLLIYSKHSKVRLFSFEPAPATFKTLSINANLHRMNMQALNCGLSSEAKEMYLVFFLQATVMSTFSWSNTASTFDEAKDMVRRYLENHYIEGEEKDFWQRTLSNNKIHKCKLETLSNIIKREHIESVDLLKIDAEGSEGDILTGIDEDCWRKLKQIVIEVHNRPLLDQVVSLLRKHHYDIIVEVPEDAPYMYLVFALDKSKSGKKTSEIKYVPFIGSPLISSRSKHPWNSNTMSNSMLTDDLVSLLHNKPTHGANLPVEFILIKSLPRDNKGKIDRRILSLIDPTLLDLSSVSDPVLGR